MWPEVTDPEKFVYEDVAIATYLLVRGAAGGAAGTQGSPVTTPHPLALALSCGPVPRVCLGAEGALG